MLGMLQNAQAEMLRRQESFEREIVQAVRDLHDDQRELLERHFDRVEEIHRELALMREHAAHCPGKPSAAPALPKPPPLRIAPIPPPQVDPEATTAWLLARINQLDEENRSSWKDLLGRISKGMRQAAP
jgi:hypothetical protein